MEKVRNAQSPREVRRIDEVERDAAVECCAAGAVHGPGRSMARVGREIKNK
jgi:hypothetical protein